MYYLMYLVYERQLIRYGKSTEKYFDPMYCTLYKNHMKKVGRIPRCCIRQLLIQVYKTHFYFNFIVMDRKNDNEFSRQFVRLNLSLVLVTHTIIC